MSGFSDSSGLPLPDGDYRCRQRLYRWLARMCARSLSICTVDPEYSNLGFAKANNIGIAAASGQYVCLINSDVKLLETALRLVEYCEAHRDVGMVGPRIIGGDGILQRSCRGFPSLWNMFCRALALDFLS